MQMHGIHFSNVQNKSTLPISRFQREEPMFYIIVYGIERYVLLICNHLPIIYTQHTWSWLNNFGILGSILEDLLYLTFSFRQIFHQFPNGQALPQFVQK